MSSPTAQTSNGCFHVDQTGQSLFSITNDKQLLGHQANIVHSQNSSSTVHNSPSDVSSLFRCQPTQSARVFRGEYGAYPLLMVCPYCRKQITTVVQFSKFDEEKMNELKVLTICGGFLLCSCLWPFCCPKDYTSHKHFCPSCERYLGYNKPKYNGTA
ncbi:unnamed protein product [Rotaria sp. Silwood2]|nr:unnamed protein product [Rotaria sp. Silwood2]CAF3130744.1 unnamed protein product [Rotaria sp. Silwood2]CAF3432133.1 unnamed protein product [Rotaria sp. Silwood2]CAF4451322.1 unnamed protein product [Rotaria sp. Silwood2]CAF4461904.1 unnamed protein product [Rotaria sp. Silwood2]